MCGMKGLPHPEERQSGAAARLEGRNKRLSETFHYCNAPTRPSNKPCPSVPPKSGSVAFSGCGISPSTVRLSLKMPAIARVEPLTLSLSASSPAGLQ